MKKCPDFSLDLPLVGTLGSITEPGRERCVAHDCVLPRLLVNSSKFVDMSFLLVPMVKTGAVHG